jgi:site-specific recombinase
MQLSRMEKLSMAMLLPTKKFSILAFCAYLFELKKKEESLAYLTVQNFNILSKKVVEHAGNTGEHYVAAGRKESLQMFYTSLGAGILTVLTCVFKFEIGSMRPPPLADFLLTGLNYSCSFTLLHFLGLTLATKQPSATASHLAHSLHSKEKNEMEHSIDDDAQTSQVQFDPAILLFLRIVRTQFIAVLGNLTGVIPCALLFSFLAYRYLNSSVLTTEKAFKTLENFSITSPSLFLFATATGVLLWFASFSTGWLQNWVVFNRVSMPKILQRNFAGVTSSFLLGFLLALPAFLGTLVGFAWDVRHVTLGAGSVVFSLFTLWKEQLVSDIWAFPLLYKAAIGVVYVGLMNVLVSFSCALLLALRALKLPTGEVFQIFLRTASLVLKKPSLILKF